MKYKELYSVEYDVPNWDDIRDIYVTKWKEKIKNEPWEYKADMEQEKITERFVDEDAKFEFLNNWEMNNKSSPLNNFYCSLNRTYYSSQDEAYAYQVKKRTYCIAEKMFDDYRDKCRDSFIELNMPSSDYDTHREYLAELFDNDRLINLDSMIESQFNKISDSYFLINNIRLMLKYQLPNDDLMVKVKEEFNKFILDGKWKVLAENDKLQNPESKYEFIIQFNNDGDSVLNHIYVKSKCTLYNEMKVKSKKKYRDSFILLNIKPEIRGTIRENNSVAEIERHFDLYYDCLAEQFCTDILNMYSKSDILELFEKDETSKLDQ